MNISCGQCCKKWPLNIWKVIGNSVKISIHDQRYNHVSWPVTQPLLNFVFVDTANTTPKQKNDSKKNIPLSLSMVPRSFMTNTLSSSICTCSTASLPIWHKLGKINKTVRPGLREIHAVKEIGRRVQTKLEWSSHGVKKNSWISWYLFYLATSCSAPGFSKTSGHKATRLVWGGVWC